MKKIMKEMQLKAKVNAIVSMFLSDIKRKYSLPLLEIYDTCDQNFMITNEVIKKILKQIDIERKVLKLLLELEDIPINEDEEIDKEWQGFSIGTDKQEIWSWIEETFNVSIGDLQSLF